MIVAPDGNRWRYEPGNLLGYILNRTVFDRRLAESAAAKGADIRTRCLVKNLIVEDQSVVGVIYERRGEEHLLRSKMVIAADGIESKIARDAGLRTQISLDDSYSTCQVTIAGIHFDSTEVQLHVGTEIAPKGYIWVFPKSKDSANVGVGIGVKGNATGINAGNYLHKFLTTQFGRYSIVSETSGFVPVARPMEKPYAPGILLAGDAGHFIYPLSGGGIFTAMYTGMQAGKVAAEAAGRDDVSETFLKNYVKLINKEIIVNNKRAYRVKKAVEKLSDEVLNRSIHEMNRLPGNKQNIRGLFTHAFRGNPRLLMDILRTVVGL